MGAADWLRTKVVTKLARLNITVPDELYERMEKWRDRLNLSRICQDAISRELNKIEEIPEEVRNMHEALSRLGEQKAKADRSSFRRGVHDGLEWAREAEYASLKRWGEQTVTAEWIEEALRGPAAHKIVAYRDDVTWEIKPYGEGWIAGVRQFWDRVKHRL